MDSDRIREEAGKIRGTAKKGGYRLHPDAGFIQGLVEGILTNRDRYGYDSCPCRLATGDAEKDRAIVCPCDFRDDDLADYGACYCALYVSPDYDEKNRSVVPDRWDPDASPASEPGSRVAGEFVTVTAQVCGVCGYLALKEKPPRKCPVCGVSHERFREVKLAVASAP